MKTIPTELLVLKLTHLQEMSEKAGETADCLFMEGKDRNMPRANYKLGFHAGIGYAVDIIRVLLHDSTKEVL